MPFNEPRLPLRDIREAIGAIEEFTAGMDFNSFQADGKTAAAVERKLLVISEAAIRLGSEADQLCAGIPWRDIRGFGNWLRHQYDRVDLRAVWKAVTDDLPPLKESVIRALNVLQQR